MTVRAVHDDQYGEEDHRAKRHKRTERGCKQCLLTERKDKKRRELLGTPAFHEQMSASFLMRDGYLKAWIAVSEHLRHVTTAVTT